MLDTDLYVACIDLTGRRAVVVGRGAVANEKTAGLRGAGADVTVIDESDYTAAALDGALLVMVAPNDMDIARRVFEDAEARALLVNVADVPELCNFILPAVMRSGPITVAVSTAGASPALAKRLRDEIADHVGDAYATLAVLLDEIRPWAKATLPTYEARRDFFDGIVNGDPDPIALLRAGRVDEVKVLIDAAQAGVGASDGEV